MILYYPTTANGVQAVIKSWLKANARLYWEKYMALKYALEQEKEVWANHIIIELDIKWRFIDVTDNDDEYVYKPTKDARKPKLLHRMTLNILEFSGNSNVK